MSHWASVSTCSSLAVNFSCRCERASGFPLSKANERASAKQSTTNRTSPQIIPTSISRDDWSVPRNNPRFRQTDACGHCAALSSTKSSSGAPFGLQSWTCQPMSQITSCTKNGRATMSTTTRSSVNGRISLLGPLDQRSICDF